MILEKLSHKVNIVVLTKVTILSFISGNSTGCSHLTCPALNHPRQEQGGKYIEGGGEEGGDDAGGKEGQKSSACSLEKTRPANVKYYACIAAQTRQGWVFNIDTSVPDSAAKIPEHGDSPPRGWMKPLPLLSTSW